MLRNIFFILMAMLLIVGKANALITGVPGGLAGSQLYCPYSKTSVGAVNMRPNQCSKTIAGWVPASGYYSVMVIATGRPNLGGQYTILGSIQTSSAYFDASKKITEQNVSVSGGSSFDATADIISMCLYLVSSNGTKYMTQDTESFNCPYAPGLPDTPSIPDTSCTINGGNALSVSLGTLERSEIPTAPDVTSAINKTVSVNCTGGKVTVNMQMSYTPVSIGSGQAVKTSANGVGAAIFYGDKALAPADITPLTFAEGSNTLTLGFQAVRDATVQLKDIPTGAFTASAVLVMTQQ